MRPFVAATLLLLSVGCSPIAFRAVLWVSLLPCPPRVYTIRVTESENERNGTPAGSTDLKLSGSGSSVV